MLDVEQDAAVMKPGAGPGAVRQGEQLPQCAVEVAVVSHSSMLWFVCEQSARLVLHELLPQFPPLQRVPVFVLVSQMLPQPPQLVASLLRSLQVLPLQTVKLVLQARTQAFAGQDQLEPLAGTAPQPTPQPVQLVVLEATSQPSLVTSQLRCEESQVGVHTELEQAVELAPLNEQMVLQAPQLFESFEVSVSQPLVLGAPDWQSRKLPVQLQLQLAVPASGRLQVAAEAWPATVSQTVPQAPQLLGVFTNVSQPLSAAGAAG